MLMQFGDALGVAREVADAVPNQATRSVQEWLRDHLAPHAAPTGQICLALAKAMGPDAGRYMAERAKEYHGLSTTQIRYFTVGMTSKDDQTQTGTLPNG